MDYEVPFCVWLTSATVARVLRDKERPLNVYDFRILEAGLDMTTHGYVRVHEGVVRVPFAGLPEGADAAFRVSLEQQYEEELAAWGRRQQKLLAQIQSLPPEAEAGR